MSTSSAVASPERLSSASDSGTDDQSPRRRLRTVFPSAAPISHSSAERTSHTGRDLCVPNIVSPSAGYSSTRTSSSP